MLIAAVPPLSIAGKLTGTLLGIAVMAIAGYLWKRRSTDSEAQDFRSQIESDARWRRPNAALMGVIGGLIVVGAWVNPAVFPIAFLIVWGGVLLATMGMVVVAIHDLLFVRKRAIEDRMRLLKQNRAELESDLKEYFRSRSHKGNGAPPKGQRF